MIIEGFRSALKSIWSNKVRSLLTVLGIIIGVTAVTTLVSLGEGLKKDVSDLIRGFGSNIVFLIGGNVDTDNPQAIGGGNPAGFISGDVVDRKDVEDVKKIEGVESVASMSLVAGSASYKNKQTIPIIFGTEPEFINALSVLEIKEGRFIKEGDDFVAVVDDVAKKNLVGDDDIIGKEIKINNQKFKVVGVIKYETGESIFGDFSNMIAISQKGATKLNDGKEIIHRAIIKVSDNYDVESVKDKIHDVVLENHDGEEDFSVLTQDDILKLLDQFLGLATALVSAIAAISLVVGGIGIMNIMLVTVTERTKEIGLRKAVGATKLDIALQFLIESIVVTLVGGALGLALSIAISIVVSNQTDLTPVITPEIIATAIGVSTFVGIVFGLWPALRAANKDPITALRYE